MMSNIFNKLLLTTIRIECLSFNRQVIQVGTGFFVQKWISEDKYKMILVSNKHILEKTDTISITINKKENNQILFGNTQNIPISQIGKSIHTHPNSEIDIAALDFTGLFTQIYPNKLVNNFIPYDMLADFNEDELGVGNSIYFIGYPDGRYDTTNNLPLIRTGIIASHPKFNFNGLPQSVIDAQVFPGSSGSPVFIDLTFEGLKNNHIDLTQKQVKLLGIVSRTMVKDNKLKAVSFDEQNYVSEEIIGLGIVFKSTLIKELIDSLPNYP